MPCASSVMRKFNSLPTWQKNVKAISISFEALSLTRAFLQCHSSSHSTTVISSFLESNKSLLSFHDHKGFQQNLKS